MKKLYLCLLILSVFSNSLSYAKEYHVSKKGRDENEGSVAKPFKTISEAIKHAFAGDTITVHSGTYREWVNPIRGGKSDSLRIVYRAFPGDKVEIKGSENIKGWKKLKSGVWKIKIPNTFFGNYNPYKDSIHGDWFNDLGRIHHTGEVFLNGRSLYEKESLKKVFDPVIQNKNRNKEGSDYTWYCETDQNNTTIWANFHEFDPNKELIEISTRKTCIYPEKQHINFITISGFYISQAATQWAAPTAEQVGMVATHWNKGWIIENNVISDSKCSGITLGKERETGHNVWSANKESINSDGNIDYIEVIFRVLRNGWNKEHIGSHIVRNNRIFNCEQTAICGSMGEVFSTIENNHIYNIWTKRQFTGAEIGGIKFHAPIDVIIRKNRIHDCGRGLWLDWMTQGTRVTQNLFYRNEMEDIFVEVNHGPFLIDNNILLSPCSISNQSDGGAYIHNLMAGSVYTRGEPTRFTPYFLPHSTLISGFATIKSGDDRYYNNIFIGLGNKPAKLNNYGKYEHNFDAYHKTKLPVWMEGNIYYNQAKPYIKDTGSVNSGNFNPHIELVEDTKNVFLYLTFDHAFYNSNVKMITTEQLGKTIISKGIFDNTDGTLLHINKDYFGNFRSTNTNFSGPFNISDRGTLKLKVW